MVASPASPSLLPEEGPPVSATKRGGCLPGFAVDDRPKSSL